MERPAIPLHQPSADHKDLVWSERIVTSDAPVRNSVHRHSYHEIFLFQSGSGRHMIDLEVVEFKAPCIHIVAPGQVHKLDRTADSHGAVIMFSGDLRSTTLTDPDLRSLLRGSTYGRNIPLTEADLAEAADLFRMIENEQLTKQVAASRVIEQYLGILLLKCLRWSSVLENTEAHEKSDLATQFVEMADRQFLEKKLVSEYASDLAVSPGHLNELVKKRTGKSASEILHERLLLEAKRLLLHSGLSVKEVSFSLKMEDPAYFTRMFRKATGMTPGDYREHIREKYQR